MYFVTAVLTVRAALTGGFQSLCHCGFISGMWIENLFVAAGWRLLRRPVCLTHTSLWAQTGPEDERRTLTELKAAAHPGTKSKQQSECGRIFQRETFKLVWSEVSSRYEEVFQENCAECYRSVNFLSGCIFSFFLLRSISFNQITVYTCLIVFLFYITLLFSIKLLSFS